MPGNPFDLDAYFARIQYHGPTACSLETLRQMHRQQALTIPFENLNIHLGLPINLEAEQIVTKLVHERRGGYCYELNGLFELAIKHLGFTYTCLAARNAMSGPPYVQKSHKLLLVEIERQPWIADVGFSGIGLIEPVPLELGREFRQCNDILRFTAGPAHSYYLQRKVVDGWQSFYLFTLEEHYPADYRMMNYFNSTSPDSTFLKRRLVAISTVDARIMLTNFELKIRTTSETTTCQLADEHEYLEALRCYFGIELPAGIAFKPLPPSNA